MNVELTVKVQVEVSTDKIPKDEWEVDVDSLYIANESLQLILKDGYDREIPHKIVGFETDYAERII